MIRQDFGCSDPNMLPVLVIGGGLSGMMTAKAMSELGLSVIMVKVDSEPSRLYGPDDRLDLEEYSRSLSESMNSVEVHELPALPEIRREGFGFYSDFGSSKPRLYGCLVLTSGIKLDGLSPDLPKGIELVSPENFSGNGRSMGFLLDYGPRSNPAAGMAAIRQAIENKKAGGESFVIFQHAPVSHLYGESLYDLAKRVGVQFYRFGEKLPLVERASVDNPDEKFLITLRDVIETGENVSLHCDEILAAHGPDPASVPQVFREVCGNDSDADGFLLSDSIHCHSGRSFRNGIFAVGEVTGETDLVRVAAQAASAAVNARAWMMGASLRKDDETVSVTQECIRCLTCYRICPHSAFSLGRGASRSTVQASAAICRECGICVSECPRLALDLNSFPEGDVASFLDEAGKGQSEPIVLYGCQRSAGRIMSLIELPPGVLFFPVPCAGRVSESMLWATLAAGAKGVLAIGCHHGNCASQTGTDWAVARVQSAVEKLNLPQGFVPRVGYASIAANEPGRFNRVVNQFCSSLSSGYQALPGNPGPAGLRAP
jgi:quinone-modifying oxidoreductase, subunit QmoB